MSSNNFLEFDDDAQTQESSSSRNPFVVLVGVLVTILILASICTVYVYSQQSQDSGGQIAAIETQNAITAANNLQVTQTIAAIETADAQPPTETATPSPVATAVATETSAVTPTATPTKQAEVSTNGTDEAPATGDAVVDAGGEDGTPTKTGTENQDGTVSAGESTPAAAFDSTGTDSTLPQTGLNTWAAILLAIFFIGLLVAARRLRSN